MVIGAMAELLSLGALVSFLSMISEPGRIERFHILGRFFELIGADTPQSVLYVSTAIFALAVLVAAGLRLLLLRRTYSFIFGISYEIAVRLYVDTLNRPYIYHTQRNSSEVLAAINKAQVVTGEIFLPLMQAFVAIVIASFIVAGLVWLDPLLALISGTVFALIYLLTSSLSRVQLQRNGKIAAKMQVIRVQAIQEGLGGIRDILLDRSQPVFIEVYEHAEAQLRDSRAALGFAAQAPRFVVESLGMIVVAVAACVLASGAGGFADAVPLLGALALGAQRLLPLFQQIYSAWAMTTGNRQTMNDLLDLLRSRTLPAPSGREAISFERALELDHVGYRYDGTEREALADICIKIPHGARIGIAGRTGSGKSTLMDIIIGLLEPTEGEIRVDGMALTSANRDAWQRNIAHVPQSIFLSDASIAENIAFGVRKAEIDRERLVRAAEQAELVDVIAGLPDGYDTRVGERGIQLSGGQRQRIGIARALYKQASVLVFDEATSALDNETEAAVMRAINRLDRKLTLLVIAHRLTTLEGCDEVIRLEGGRIVRQSAPTDRASVLPEEPKA